MKILLDTHAWVWWLVQNNKLPGNLLEKIDSAHHLAVSAISCWEAAYLVKKGRVQIPIPIREWMDAALKGSGVSVVYVSDTIAVTSANLPDIHRDPADRIIIATAIVEDYQLVSLDARFKEYEDLVGRMICE